MSHKNNQPLISRNFYIKLIIAFFGALVVTIAIVGVAKGFNYVLESWELLLGMFISLGIIITITTVLMTRRLVNFFLNSSKRPFITTLGFFINLIMLVYTKPKFLMDFHPFQEDFSLLAITVISWLLFPIIFSKKFLESSFLKVIPAPVKMLFGFFFLTIILVSLLFLAMIDILAIFLFFL